MLERTCTELSDDVVEKKYAELSYPGICKTDDGDDDQMLLA